MSAFQPTMITIHPPPEPDPLGSALAAALRRDVALKLTWNLPAVLVLGLATAGLAPLIVLVVRFRLFAIAQKFQLEHVSEWLEQSDRSSDELRRATRSLAHGWGALTILAMVLAGVAALVAAAHLWRAPHDPFSLLSLWMWRGGWGGTGVIFGFAIILAFACQWLAISKFAGRVNEFITALEDPLTGNFAPPQQQQALLPRWRWFVAGTVLLLGGIAWGLPMMVAGGAHKRYINDISRAIRNTIADRIEALMQRGERSN
jgi:hypothetical protein